MTSLLIGYYGHGNLGDELLFEKTCDMLRDVYPDDRIALSKASFLFADRVIFGAGGLFQNTTSTRSLMYYSFWAMLASVFGKPYVLLAQGIGPVKGRFSNWILDLVIKRSAGISVRDEISEKRVKAVGADCKVGADLAFFQADLHDLQHPEGSSLMLNLRPWKIETDEWPLINDLLLRKCQGFLGFSHVDMHYGEGLEVMDMRPYLLCNELFPFPLSGVVAMRYHACVWAALNGLPFLALVYDEKVMHLAKSLKQPYLDVRIGSLLYEDCRVAIDQFESSLEAHRRSLLEHREALLTSAAQHRMVFDD